MKRFFAILLILAMLPGLFGCQKAIVIEDVNANGLKWGNTLATEQGAWVALYGEEDGQTGLILYNKETDQSRFLVEGRIFLIALLENKIYFKYDGGSELYCYDIAKEDYGLLLEGVMAYQIRGSIIYYLTDVHGNYLNTYDLSTREHGKISVSYTVDAFWLTDDALYYSDDTKGLLMVRPHETERDRILYQGEFVLCRDVVALEGEDVAFIGMNQNTGLNSLYRYTAESDTVTELLRGSFDHFNLVRSHLVFAEENTICAMDLSDYQVYSWGTIEEEYSFIEIMSDCVIYYVDDRPYLQYYPDPEE